MATEKITIRLSDQDPTEAEIIAILRGKVDGRKAPWLRDLLVDGYRALSAAGRYSLHSHSVSQSPTPSVSIPAPRQSVTANESQSETKMPLDISSAPKMSETVGLPAPNQNIQTPMPVGMAEIKTSDVSTKPVGKGGAKVLKLFVPY